jgi:acetylornithine deacetylase/succinyl-diaminopimelate desuccinylase-like protein
MKAGIAAALTALRILAGLREHWRGELVMTLAGDEENMGSLGSRWLLEHVSEAKGDAMLCGDVGSPMVLRFGEKGLCWVELEAEGRPAHGAHVHKGANAIDRLRRALDGLKRLEDLPVVAPAAVTSAIMAAKPISEELSGEGEAETLQRVTVNIGTMEGGISPNLVPARARATADIRLPVGVSLEAVEAALHRELDPCQGVTWRIIRAYPPSFTPANRCWERRRSPTCVWVRPTPGFIACSACRAWCSAARPSIWVRRTNTSSSTSWWRSRKFIRSRPSSF